MAKLSRPILKLHQQACDLINSDRPLTTDEREFIIGNWQESAEHINSAAGAFFTPIGLAFDFALDVSGHRILDLCAGIGALSYAAYWRGGRHGDRPEITCVELNPDYVKVGTRVMPEARWITANVMDLPDDIGTFDWVISNPPFGKTIKIAGPRYTGEADLAVIDIASQYAPSGTFIIPVNSAPFLYSGRPYYERRPSAKFDRFNKMTGIELEAGVGVDCSYYRSEWRGTAPAVEIVCADFEQDTRSR